MAHTRPAEEEGDQMGKKMRLRLRRPSPAMIVAMLALLVATVGTAGATGLKTHYPYWTGVDIVNGSLTGADVKNKSLTPADFRGSVRGPRGPAGANGANGANGAKGDKGDKGDTGSPGHRVGLYARQRGRVH